MSNWCQFPACGVKPITAAIIMAAGPTHRSKLSGVEHGSKPLGNLGIGQIAVPSELAAAPKTAAVLVANLSIPEPSFGTSHCFSRLSVRM